MNPKRARLTPRPLGFRLPAEWEPHEATWICWPQNPEDWPGKFAAIPWVYADFVKNLSRHETVRILVSNASTEGKAADCLDRAGADMGRVRFHQIRTNRSWTRDYLPSFLVRQSESPPELGLVDWKFNAWAKYDDFARDDRVPARLAKTLGGKHWKPSIERDGVTTRIVLEGGAIDTNGQGTLLTTEECLLSPIQARNPGLDRGDIEEILRDYLSIDRVIWLGNGIVGDDTHGHVDDIARFINPTTVAAAVESDPGDPNFQPSKQNEELLRRSIDQSGNPLEIVRLPMPRPVLFEGQRLPASYANFYIANGIVLVPTFNDPADRVALRILEEAFPDRQVVGIHSLDLVWGLGTLHCMTHEQPALPGQLGPPARSETELPARLDATRIV